MINENTKQQIRDKMLEFVDRMESQNKAAKSIGVSSATLAQIKNHKWENIAEEMWRKIGARVGWKEEDWVTVETRDFKKLENILSITQKESLVKAVIGAAGTGKSETLKHYRNTNKKVYLLRCSEFWNRKYFLSKLLQAMGRNSGGLTVAEMMDEVVSTLKSRENTMIIIDEADKLSDQVLYFFITIYNELEDHCAIILCATEYLKRRIEKGQRTKKKGFEEIYSRIGKRFIELNGVCSSDVAAICVANGITDNTEIKEIYEDCESDLRRVKDKVRIKRKGKEHKTAA